ncbi:MAG: hypothetical protein QW520_07260 [Methanomassiliicoccales archaeon]
MTEKVRTSGGACGGASVDESKKIWVAGANVGISNWSKVVEEVRALGLKDNEKIADELLLRVKKNDFVPRSKEGEYRKVLLEEYLNTP